MRVQLAQQVQELLEKRELVIITERVDDVALLIGQLTYSPRIHAGDSGINNPCWPKPG